MWSPMTLVLLCVKSYITHLLTTHALYVIIFVMYGLRYFTQVGPWIDGI